MKDLKGFVISLGEFK